MNSYSGRILHIDVTNRTTRVQAVGENWLCMYVGGVSMATRLAYDQIPPGADPLGPDNALCFANSVFSGTLVPAGTRHAVAAKSPLTGFLGDCLAGGHFSASMRRAGWDAIVISGTADRPLWILVEDDVVRFHDASDLWGKEALQTEDAIRATLGDDRVRATAIGPAGEKLVRFANMSNDRCRQSGSAGLGAVMGSKLLKAVAIRGTGSVSVADPDSLCKAALDLTRAAQGSKLERYRNLGTADDVLVMNRLGVLPTRNYQQGEFDHADALGVRYIKDHFWERSIACAGCPIPCEHIVRVRQGDYAGAMTAIDYESLSALGSNCGSHDLPGIIAAVERCDALGLDTLSAGAVVSWAMECFQRGILTQEDFGGLEPTWGNHRAVVELVRRIASREGIGDLLAEGTRRAASRIGKASEAFAMDVKGMGGPAYDARGFQMFALACAVGTSGPCHDRTFAYESDADGSPTRLPLGKDRGAAAKDGEDVATVLNTVMLSKFMRDCFSDLWTEIPRLFEYATGLSMTSADLTAIAERTSALRKAFNLREGWTKADDWLPMRWLEEPLPAGAFQGAVVDEASLREAIAAYYEARGWTAEGQLPRAKLHSLGLGDLAEGVGA